MNLTPDQRTVLLTLTAAWQAPTHIADRLSTDGVDLTIVNQALKDLLSLGLAQANPVVIGMYRLTAEGTAAIEI